MSANPMLEVAPGVYVHGTREAISILQARLAALRPVEEQSAARARGIFAIDQVWKSRDGRRLRVVCIDPKRIGVRNCATGRLSYWRPDVMQRLSALETSRTASDA